MQIRHIIDRWDWGLKKRRRRVIPQCMRDCWDWRLKKKGKKAINKVHAHPGNRTLVSTVGGYYDTTTPDALLS